MATREDFELHRESPGLNGDQLFQIPNLLLCIADTRTGKFVRLTPAWQDFLGYSLEELQNIPWINFVHPDDLESTYRITKQIQKTGQAVEFRNRYRKKDGTYRWIQWNVTAVGPYHYGAVTDVTNIKETEEALRVVTDRLSLALHASQIGIWEVDLQTRIAQISREQALILSLNPERTTVHMNEIRSHVHPDDILLLDTSMEAAIRERKEYQVEFRVKRPDCTVKWVLAMGRPYYDKNDRPIKIAGTAVDITDRKNAENKLKSEYNIIKQMTDTLPILFWWTDEGGKGNHFNKKWFEYTGLPESEDPSSYENFFQVIHPEDHNVNLAARREAVRLRKTAKFEERIRRWDGEYRWHLVHATPILDDHGNLIRWYANSTDIHEQKLLQMERAKTAENLQSEKEYLSHQNRELDRFAAIAAHDLKSPLNSITQFTELLAEQYRGKLDADADEYLDFIISAGNRMRGLIDNLLEFARAGSIDRSKFTTVNINNVIATVKNNLLTEIQKSDAKIKTPPKLPNVLGVELQLVQLFQNLIANAIKFHKPHQSPKIEIEFSDAGEDCWRFSIRDEGIGIDPKNFDRMFEIFSRFHTRSQIGGSGIGLAVCKKIVEAHSGKISFQSEPGVGTSFHFSLLKCPSKDSPNHTP